MRHSATRSSCAADPGSTLFRVRLTQLQDEVIDAAHSQGQIDPATFARLLLHDLGDVHVAISDLVDRDLVAVEDDTYRLTDQGEVVHRAREEAHRAAVVARTSSWQRR
jgi:Mn-dependent DtxR family transcriptional regulator